MGEGVGAAGEGEAELQVDALRCAVAEPVALGEGWGEGSALPVALAVSLRASPKLAVVGGVDERDVRAEREEVGEREALEEALGCPTDALGRGDGVPGAVSEGEGEAAPVPLGVRVDGGRDGVAPAETVPE